MQKNEKKGLPTLRCFCRCNSFWLFG